MDKLKVAIVIKSVQSLNGGGVFTRMIINQ